MVFQVKLRKDRFADRIFGKAMKELGGFFGRKLENNQPNIFIVPDRNSIDLLFGMKTERWIVGWINGTDLFVLDRKNYEKESCNKYSEKDYEALIKHELTHIFFGVLSGSRQQPLWLSEGLAVYLSGQNGQFRRPEKFVRFLRYYKNSDLHIYKESGFAVEFLVKKFGKKKLLRLIKSLKEVDSEKKFSEKFKDIYGFDLTYQNFNERMGARRL